MSLRVASIALGVLVAACSGPSGPKPAELPQLEHEARIRELWSASVGDGMVSVRIRTRAGLLRAFRRSPPVGLRVTSNCSRSCNWSRNVPQLLVSSARRTACERSGSR